MDDERLKNDGSAIITEYFDRLLEQIRETRSLERIVSAYFAFILMKKCYNLE